ncbi:small-conductance mechanosensitive channel [Gracilibacillus caseinilyticus]|uniref:Small-conductance mechanosensitive channel n=1 Tax=Gracilibacillus caseinilyticus TaxID=2932256 RepID=A0ABY4EZT8_9BACI|nr:small-conductance mechanosensitive channel [Gracilibacillus caseinilyticus]UOQ49367.1 small-conductance mechanosensitive channel [Gracilibacillus caseinilyticus]
MEINQETVKQHSLELEAASPSDLTMDQFHGKSHFWGRLTIWSAILLSVGLPLYLSFGLGYHPGWSTVIAGCSAYIALVGFAWVFEPITYYPALGISGTYISFLTGNISNMCLPSSAAAQNAVNAEPGTKKGEVAATLGIAAASLVNIAILIPTVLGGSVIVSILPESVESVFAYIVPAIFGGIFAQFALKKPSYAVVAVIVGLIVNIAPITYLLKAFLAIPLTITICINMEKMKKAKTNH